MRSLFFALLAGSIGVATGCRPMLGPVVDWPPVWHDPDRRPFSPKPEDDAPTRLWDGFDQIVLRRATDSLAVRASTEAANVNAMDEVPTSSWFTNRIGLLPMSLEDLAAGPCTDPPIDPDALLEVTSSKLDGITPGFVAKVKGGKQYVFKLDDVDQTPRPTAADAIASRIYYAAGYTTPCNRVFFVERSRLSIAAGAKLTTWTGVKRDLTPPDLDLVLTRASRLPDGRYRVLASQYLPGEPIGPWRYEKTRPGDPNDVIPHEDRREVRAIRLLAAWLDNTDSRAQNTLDVWVTAGANMGWVRHTLLDFSDCFGALWEPTDRWRRMGHAYWLDLGVIASDYVTLGLRPRGWEDARLGPFGKVFGYYDIDTFDPEAWKMETPNPAFSRMTERDGAWMARIIARFGDAHLERVIRTGRLGTPALESELLRLVAGRRDRILRRYLSRVSPLAEPVVDGRSLCVRDLAVSLGLQAPRAHSATFRGGGASSSLPVISTGSEVCTTLPPFDRGDVEVDFEVMAGLTAPGPLRAHLRFDRGALVLTAIERPGPT